MCRFSRYLAAVRIVSHLFILALCVWGAGALLPGTCLAEEIATLDGKKYESVRDIKPMHDRIVFSYGPESDHPDRTTVLFRNLPVDLQKKYGYDPFEEGLYNARANGRISLTLNSAFRLSSLEAAKKKAQAEHKLLGFIMVWDMFFQPAQPMGAGGPNDLAGFYTVFNNALVLVFVRHEDELDKVPAAVRQGFFGPDEGGWAPNMAVVTADCSQYVCEIPMGGAHTSGAMREPIFRAKIAVIKKFLENPEAFAPKAVQQTNTESATVEPAKAETNEGDILPGQRLESIRRIPQQTRLLHSGLAAISSRGDLGQAELAQALEFVPAVQSPAQKTQHPEIPAPAELPDSAAFRQDMLSQPPARKRGFTGRPRAR